MKAFSHFFLERRSLQIVFYLRFSYLRSSSSGSYLGLVKQYFIISLGIILVSTSQDHFCIYTAVACWQYYSQTWERIILPDLPTSPSLQGHNMYEKLLLVFPKYLAAPGLVVPAIKYHPVSLTAVLKFVHLIL